MFTPNRINEKQNHRQELRQKLEKKRKQQKEISKKVRDWADFSLKPQSEEAIRKRVIHDLKTGENTYCMSYICTMSELSEDFIEELYQLTKSHKTKASKLYDNKLDWIAISAKQKLSEEFIEKHEKDVDWRMIYQFQELSNEFKKKYAHKLTINDRPKED